uniref:Uncharacterized protein n=1 Tax=uncultured marine bacterium 463 TaxID=257394 RepID=Q6SGR7_9BACT|nr:hypothetical protein MBMO_EBAC080-L32B05.43 [uncultured marine bacterium 463]
MRLAYCSLIASRGLAHGGSYRDCHDRSGHYEAGNDSE